MSLKQGVGSMERSSSNSGWLAHPQSVVPLTWPQSGLRDSLGSILLRLDLCQLL